MPTTISSSTYGRTGEGKEVACFTLANSSGFSARIITYGGRIVDLHVPDRKGERGNVVLGYESLEGYLGPNPYFGAIIGRVGNRIAGGRFELDGMEYHLPTNNGPNTLHGGTIGFDRAVWEAAPVSHREGAGVKLTHLSPDRDQGFPGNLSVMVSYVLRHDRNELRVDYEATTDKATPVNMTNHSYFNLAGAGRGDILDHEVMIRADGYTPVDEALIPTGQIAEVGGTPMDFRAPTRVGERIGAVKGGYDANYVLQGGSMSLGGIGQAAASARDERSGRMLEVFTTQPGVQLYTGNFLDGSPGNGGAYIKHGALCLETQHFPDAVHHANFPSTILRPGGVYRQAAVYRFSAG